MRELIPLENLALEIVRYLSVKHANLNQIDAKNVKVVILIIL